MGSFTSKASTSGEDVQDNDLKIPSDLSHDQMLAWVQKPLQSWPQLMQRKYTCMPNSPLELFDARCTPTFRIMTWNILADALGCHADYLVKCPPEALEWKNRRFRILQEILHYNPDIICLQEVDHFNLFKNVLETQGYSGTFSPKPDSPCIYLPDNNGPDGCAFFYKSAKFSLQSLKTRILEVWNVQSNQVAVMATLQEINSGEEFVVLTTHLKARKGAFLSTLRNEQGNDLLSFLSDDGEGKPAIICGDFNAEETEPVYTTMTENSHGLKSAYAELYNGNEPPYTTWKIRRDGGEQKHTIDYMFYTKSNVDVEGGFSFPGEDEVDPDRLPCFSYPSDHFSLICDFYIKRKLKLGKEQSRGRL